MIRERAALNRRGGIAALCAEWFAVELSADECDRIACEWSKIEAQSAAGCLSSDVDTSVGVLVWLKNRLREVSTCFEPLQIGQQDIRLVTLMHFESLCEPDESTKPVEPVYARSKMFRSPLLRREPIDVVARRLMNITDNRTCSACGKHFRNAAAHRIHFAECHLEVA